MIPSRERDERRFAHLRGPADPTLANLIRWERIKLWEAAQDALALLNDFAPTTEQGVEALWTDTEFKALRERMKAHRARVAELLRMQSEEALAIPDGPPLPDDAG